MKRIIPLLALTLMFAVACKNREKSGTEDNPKASLSFESTVHNFGTIPYESDGRCYFEFTNTSDVPLVINDVRTTCGCTRPEWPSEPVSPGEKGKIGITYNTKIQGNFQKTITVYSNTTDSPTRLMIKGKVETGPEQDKTK